MRVAAGQSTLARLARAARRRAARDRAAHRRRARAGPRPRTPGCTATRSAPCRRRACPRRSPSDVPDAMERLVRRFARTHGPFETDALRDRYGVDFTPVLQALERVRRARARRAAPGRHAARVVRPRGAAAAAARLARRAAQGDRAGRPARARALPAELAGRRPPPAGGRRARPPARGADRPPGAGAARRGVGARRAAAPRRRLLAVVDGPAVRRGRARVGRRGRARPPLRQVALYFREDVRAARAAAAAARRRPPGRAHDAIRERLRAGACFFTDLLADIARRPERGAPGGAVGPRVGGRGRPTTPTRRCARRG